MADTKMLSIMRYYSKTGKDDFEHGAFSVDNINEYISVFLNRGYKLADTHYVGMNDYGYGVLFILLMDELLGHPKTKKVED